MKAALSGNPVVAAVIMLLSFAGLACGLLVALAIYPEHAARLYGSAVLCPLPTAGLMLWLTVRSLVFSLESPAPT